ncbi:hypothetical protein [Clostridium uliginosum]|uniref:Uncharacterized protein n=1 Tax=Clostridium uliginosum TaxID=119641 RepID=A0A1I1GYD4_9CLOT|nr:hypothetical protein [Clostridium uliginosum]SFC16292.1 hypothetical protein SAMN05421842_10195 [Clostridium uliginosum]
MKIMYITYQQGRRKSIIKEGVDILMSDVKISPVKQIKKLEVTNVTSNSDNKINEEITGFFINAVHKNYLANRLRY